MNIYEKRVNLVKNKIAEQNLDGLYITNLTKERYLTGFTGSAASVFTPEIADTLPSRGFSAAFRKWDPHVRTGA